MSFASDRGGFSLVSSSCDGCPPKPSAPPGGTVIRCAPWLCAFPADRLCGREWGETTQLPADGVAVNLFDAMHDDIRVVEPGAVQRPA